MTDLLQRVEQSIQNRRLLPRGGRVLVAVSGGLDSLVLLHILRRLSIAHRWRLAVAHFNHQLRGRASDADETLVRHAAAALKLPFVAGRADVKAFARRSKLSLEMAARKLRHEFLARAARRRKMAVVALAHHADDQVELFFLRLLRGAGGEGLAGMKWQSPSPADPEIALIRPLLDCSKPELLAFGRENKIRFREDATNFSNDFLRNRVRHELLPLLRKKYQPGLNQAVLRLMEIVGAEAELADAAARRWQKETGGAGRPAGGTAPRLRTRPDFKDLPVAVQRKVLQRQLIRLGVPADFELIERLREKPDRPVSAGAGLAVARDAAGKTKLLPQTPENFNAGRLALTLAGRAGEAVFGGKKFGWRIRSQKKFIRPARQAGREEFDADRVGGRITLRHWRPGDRFQPLGLKSAVKLQDLFTNAKIPRARRRELVVAEAEAGGLCWVEGLRMSEPFKLTPATQRRLIWHWQGVPPFRQPKKNR